MPSFPPLDDRSEARVREHFTTQRVMATIGAELQRVAPGLVEIALPFRDDLTQQNGYLHAGIVTTVVDSACGYAAYSLMPAGSEVLTVEYKVNFLSPAEGPRFLATGRVVKAGRTLTVCHGEVVALGGEAPKTVALMQTTMIRVAARA